MFELPQSIHATALVVGDKGILIRGGAGAGKSTLAHQFLALASRDNHFARLISDDRVYLTAAHGRVFANSIPSIEGLLEIRGVGIVSAPFLSAAVIDLVIDLDDPPLRMPEGSEQTTILLNTTLPRLAMGGVLDAADRILWLLYSADS